MATVIVTSANWNDPSFWSGVSMASGDTLDMSALGAGNDLTLDEPNNRFTIEFGGVEFSVGGATATGTDAVLSSGSVADISTFVAPDGSLTIKAGDGGAGMVGGAGDDYLLGGDGNDRLDGKTGNDTLDGGAGDDTIDLEDDDGAATVTGGEGYDRLDVDDVAGNGFSVTFDGDNSGAASGGTLSVTFSDIEEVQTSSQADTIDATLDSSGLELDAAGGDDVIRGGSGADTIEAGAGADTIYGGNGASGVDPLVRLDFGDGASGTASDASGNGYDGIYQGGANAGGTGWDGSSTAVQLDGTDDYVEIPPSNDFGLTDGTVAIRFYADDVSGAQELISRDSDYYDGGGHFHLQLQGDGAIDLRMQSDSGDFYIRSDPGLVSNETWHHVAVSFGGDGVALYLDGVEIGTNAYTGGIDGNNEPWTLGASQMSSNDGVANNLRDFFDGALDEFLVYDSQLDPGDIATLAAQGATAIAPAGDVLSGGDDADTFVIDELGNTTVSGGSGGTDDDTLDLSALDSGVTFDSENHAGIITDGAETLGYSEIENIIATEFGDSIDAGSGVAEGLNLEAGGGDDTVLSSSNADIIDGGAGHDSIHAASGADSVIGGTGNDTLEGGGENDTLDGGAGDDSLLGGDHNDVLRGGDDHDILFDDHGNDTLEGGSGNDWLDGGSNSDTLDGGIGDDTLVAGFGSDSFIGGEGYDFLSVMGGEVENYGFNINLVTNSDTYGNTYDGIEGIIGGNSDDTFVGDEADNWLEGGAGNDSIDGGTGNDFLKSGTGQDTLDGGEGDDTLMNAAGDDSLVGGDGDDLIVASQGQDTLEGDAGLDTLMGGTDGDSLDGGADADLLLGDLAGVRFNETGTDGVGLASSITDFPTTQLTFEITFSSTQDPTSDVVLGSYATASNNANEFLVSLEGGQLRVNLNNGSLVDTGLPAASFLDGSVQTLALSWDSATGALEVYQNGVSGYSGTVATGASLEQGGTFALGQEQDDVGGGFNSNQIFDGTIYGVRLYDDARTPEEISDAVHAPVASTADPNLVANWVADPGSATFTDQTGNHAMAMSGDAQASWSHGNDTLQGGDGADSIFGGDGDDSIDGGGGNDSIDGGDGADTIYYGDGDNTVTGGDGDDYIDDEGGNPGYTGANVVDAGAGSDTVYAGYGDDTVLGGAGDDELYGQWGEDFLSGGAGNDTVTSEFHNSTLDGGLGADSVAGGYGDDSLTGGAGDDTVSGGGGADTIASGGNLIANGSFEFTDETGTHQAPFGWSLGGTANSGGLYSGDADRATDGDNSFAMGGWSGNVGSTLSQDVAVEIGEDYTLTFDIGATISSVDQTVEVQIDDGNGNVETTVVVVPAGTTTATTIDYTATTASINIRFTHLDGEEGDADLDNVVLAPVSDGDDLLSGGDDADTFLVADGFGNDTIQGGEGGIDDDVIDLSALTGPVTVSYDGDEAGTITDGTDTISFSEIERVILSDQGDSVDGDAITSEGLNLDMHGGNDTVMGSDFGDTIEGGDGNDSIDGGAGDDLLTTGTGNDTLVGGAGNDTLMNSDGDDSLDGGDGDDSIVATGGNDTLRGGAGNDTMDGGADNDLLDGGAGNDSMIGGAGDDTFTDTADTTLAISVGGTARNGVNPEYEVYVDGVLIHTGEVTWAQTGSFDANAAGAFQTVDIPYSGSTPGSVELRFVNDYVTGDDGTPGDRNLHLDSITVGSTTYEAESDATISGGFAGSEDANLWGTGSTATFDTTDAATTSGDDTMEGGDDADTFTFGDGFGNDVVVGGEGGTDNDDIDLSGVTGPVTVTYDGPEEGTITDGTDTITFSEIERIDLTDQADSVDASADSAGSRLEGEDGNDTIRGGTGADTIDGGDDDDSILGGAGDDSLDGGLGNDTLEGGADNDMLEAWRGDDLLDGGTGNDSLYGEDGADTLRGGTGDDLLDGGDDADTFEIEDGFGNDTITGGEQTSDISASDEDAIDLSALTGPVTVTYSGAESGTITNGTDTISFSEIERVTATDLSDSIDADANTNDITIEAGDGNDTVVGSWGDHDISGGGGDDELHGGSGNSTLDGGAGDDTLFANFSRDTTANTYIGGDDTDTFIVDGTNVEGYDYNINLASGVDQYGNTYSSIENVESGDGDDTLTGDAADNRLDGGDGSDSFVVEDGFGNDTIIGGEGGTDDDVLDLSALTGGVTVTYTGNEEGTITDGTDTITFSEIERIIGTDEADYIDADADSTGVGIDGGSGNDTIIGGSGNDTVAGNGGDNAVTLGGGDDVYSGSGNSQDTVYGGTGNDTISLGYHSTGNEAYGEDGDDVLTGNNGNQALYGGDGNDTITGGSEYGTHDTDTLDGGDGNDSIVSGSLSTSSSAEWEGGGDLMRGGAGDDTIIGGGAEDTLIGGTGADAMEGGDATDTFIIEDGFGNDTITGGEGADFGEDEDVIDLSALTGPVTVSYSGAESGTITDGTDTISFAEIERVILGDSADVANATGVTEGINLDAGDGDNTITGGDGNDTLVTGDGADQISDGEGDDSVVAGDGDDTIGGWTGNDTFEGGAGHDKIEGGDGADSIDGGTGDDFLVGYDAAGLTSGSTAVATDDAAADTISGGSGDDTISGGQGADALDGGDDADTFIIQDGFGADTITGGEGGDDSDALDLSALTGSVTVTYTGDEEGTITDGTDTISFAEIERVILGDQADVVDASGAVSGGGDRPGINLDAGGGNDTITGSRGYDSIDGGDGADSIDGDYGDDTILGGAGNDTLRGDDGIELGNDLLIGGAGDDSIDGGTQADTLAGGSGNDSIEGGDGNDVISGDNSAENLITNGNFATGDMSGWTVNNPTGGGAPEVNQGGAAFNGGNEASIGDSIQQDFDAPEGVAHTLTLELSEFGGASESHTALIEILDDDGNVIASETHTVTDGGLVTVNLTFVPTSDQSTLRITNSASSDSHNSDLKVDNVSVTASDTGTGNDTVDGGDGHDTIDGGGGDDSLTGGTGDDVFIYEAGDGADTITDFNTSGSGSDSIDLGGYYDGLRELREDFEDDGELNQSNSTDNGGTVDYSNNDRFGSGEGITFQNTSDSGAFTAENTNTVCFADGTLIATRSGEVPIETLRPGDVVITRDNGPQPLVWVTNRTLTGSELRRSPKLKPIIIAPDLIGADAPLRVSRQHGVLISVEGQERLIRAVHLARMGASSARVAQGCRRVTYFHLAFERHQIIFANGAPSESFYPGPQAVAALHPATRAELFDLFPDLPRDGALPAFGATARQFAKWRTLRDHPCLASV